MIIKWLAYNDTSIQIKVTNDSLLPLHIHEMKYLIR